MTRFRVVANRSELLQLVGGGIALLLATFGILLLTTNGLGSELGKMALGLVSVVLFAGGALSVGTSETAQV